ncbi:hypothetical protein MXB_616, partial [Myxobolus squamalis]
STNRIIHFVELMRTISQSYYHDFNRVEKYIRLFTKTECNKTDRDFLEKEFKVDQIQTNWFEVQARFISLFTIKEVKQHIIPILKNHLFKMIDELYGFFLLKPQNKTDINSTQLPIITICQYLVKKNTTAEQRPKTGLETRSNRKQRVAAFTAAAPVDELI